MNKLVKEFWPGHIDSFLERMERLWRKYKKLDDEDLILLSLYEIMTEQQRTGHRSNGWPSDSHQAIRFTICERLANETMDD